MRGPFLAVGGALGRAATAPRILPCGSPGRWGWIGPAPRLRVRGAGGAVDWRAGANGPAQQALGMGESGDSDREAGPRRGNHTAAGRGMGEGGGVVAAEGQADGGVPC